jgi:hypothetical protein
MRWLLVLLAAPGLCVAAQEEPPLRVFFLGNSYTYYNDLPALVVKLAAASPGRKIDAKAVTRGGSTLADLWSLTNAVETLRDGDWDYVVLQDQSTLGTNYVDGKWIVHEPIGLLKWAKFWQAEISRKNAKTVFYLTWARKARPDFQAALNYAYSEAAKENNALIAPAGLAWKRLRESAPQLELFDPDGSHPAAAGSLLTACVFLETLAGRSCATVPQVPVGIKINDTEWKLLIEAAEYATSQYRAGALSNLLRPDYGAARPLTAPKSSDAPLSWLGTWKGNAQIYDGIYQLELRLTDEGKLCQGSLQTSSFSGKTQFLYSLTNCRLESGVLSFTTLDLRGIQEEFRAIQHDGKLIGNHAIRSADPYRRVIGSFELRRNVDK